MLSKHITRKTFQDQQNGERSQFWKVKKKKTSKLRHSVLSKCRVSRNFVGAVVLRFGLFRHPKAKEKTRKTCHWPICAALRTKRDAANVSSSPLLCFVVGVLLTLALAAHLTTPTYVELHCWPKTTSSASACRASGIHWANTSSWVACSSVGVFVYDCDLSSSIKFVVVAGCSLLGRVYKKIRRGRLLVSSGRRSEPSPLQAAFLGRLKEHTLDNLQFLLLRHCAELVQLRLRQPRLDGVDGYMVILRLVALDHRLHQKRPRARLDETLADRQIEFVPSTGPKLRGVPASNYLIVSVGSAPSLLQHASVCIPSLRRWPLRKSPWPPTSPHQTTSADLQLNGTLPLQRCKVKIEPLLPTVHISYDNEIEVASFSHELLRDAFAAGHAYNAYVHFSGCRLMLSCVDVEELLHTSAIASFVCRVHGISEDFLEIWYEQESANTRVVGVQRKLPCLESRNLVEIVAGHQKLEELMLSAPSLGPRKAEFVWSCPLCEPQSSPWSRMWRKSTSALLSNMAPKSGIADNSGTQVVRSG